MATTIPNLSDAIERLRKGGVVAFPTETVYGMGADALNEAAVRRVYELKGRPAINPLIVHVSGPEMATKLTGVWTDEAALLARTYWPGPLTLVLPRAAPGPGKMVVPDIVTAGGPTVAVRCPDHPVALALLFGLGSPLVGPSANPSGGVSPTRAEHVRGAFDESDVLVLDGGACRTGIESTVLDLTARDRPRVLRPGMIGAGEIAAVLGRRVDEPGAPGAGETLKSPGLLARHYAPRTRARLVSRDELREALAAAGSVGRRVAVLVLHGAGVAPPHEAIVMPAEAEEYAHVLYAALREGDAMGADEILIECPPEDSAVWVAVLDRLRRAVAE